PLDTISCSYGLRTCHLNCPGRLKENLPDWRELASLSIRCCVNWPDAEGTSAMNLRNCATASADQAASGIVASNAATRICLIFIGRIPRRNQNFTIAIGLHG